MKDFLDQDHAYLSLDYPSEIVYEGRAYTCAATLYLALTNPTLADRLAKPTTGPKGWQMAKDPHDEEAMRVAVRAKFANSALADRLIEEEYVFYLADDGIWGITDEELGLGQNVCGAIHEDVRDEIAEARERASHDEAFVIHDVWPGHVAKSVYGDDVMWLRIPNVEVRGTISTIVPAADIYESEHVIRKGKFAGKHYLDVYLSQDDYPIAHHDESGHVQTISVAPRYSRNDILRSFRANRKRDLELRKAQSQKQKRKYNPEDVTAIRPGKWPDLDYRIRPRTDDSLGCELIMVNKKNGRSIDLSVPVACDVKPVANECVIACDPTGIELAVDCALADGAIWPAILPHEDGRKTFVQFDSHDNFAWLTFNIAPDIVMRRGDKEYLDYLQRGHRDVGQIRKDWKSLMPKRKPTTTIQETITRVCMLSAEEDPRARKEMVTSWLEQGVYMSKA